MKDGYYQYSISFASQITSPEELENVYLNINGRLLQIKDIARSGIRPREKRGIFFNGAKQSLCLAVIKQSNARMSEMKEKVTGLLDQFREEYPDVEFSVSRDQAQLLNYSIARNITGNRGHAVFSARCPITCNYRHQYSRFGHNLHVVFPADRNLDQHDFTIGINTRSRDDGG